MGTPVVIEGQSKPLRVTVKDPHPAFSTSENRPAVWNTAEAQYVPPSSGYRQAVWRSDLFDLRPDLGDRSAYLGDVAPINPELMLGLHFTLHFTLRGFTVANKSVALTAGVRWYAMEYAAVVNPTQATPSGDRVEITSSVYAANTAFGGVTLRFAPIDTVRYWAVAIIAEHNGVVDPVFSPPLMADTSMH